jgi:hypothetical protein
MVQQLQKPNHRKYSDCTGISVQQKTNLPPQVHRCHLLFLLLEPYRRVSCHGLLLLHFFSKQHPGRDTVFVGTEVPAIQTKKKRLPMILSIKHNTNLAAMDEK